VQIGACAGILPGEEEHTVESLRGVRVALLEARRESELASLVRRHGGEPVCVPALREVERDFGDELARACDRVEAGGATVVLTTGTGLERVLRVADAMNRGEGLRGGLARGTVVCRGPKPIAVLKREGLAAHVRAEAPHTTAELIAALAALPLDGRDAVVVHDGGTSRAIADWLRSRGARVFDVRPYEWALPEDVGSLRDLVGALVAGQLEALAVTTQVQARHLFQIADAMGVASSLRDALRERVVVAAVGPTCAQALEELGTPAHVVPHQSKMGPMVIALAEYLAQKREPKPA
jgi:uroporphyrinogen-III synthase